MRRCYRKGSKLHILNRKIQYLKHLYAGIRSIYGPFITGSINCSTGATENEPTKPLSVLVNRDIFQSGFIELAESPSPKCILLPGRLDAITDLQLLVAREDKETVKPVENDEIGSIFVRTEYLRSNQLVQLETASKFLFSRKIEGIPGSWVNTGLAGAQLADGSCVLVGNQEELFPGLDHRSKRHFLLKIIVLANYSTCKKGLN